MVLYNKQIYNESNFENRYVLQLGKVDAEMNKTGTLLCPHAVYS